MKKTTCFIVFYIMVNFTFSQNIKSDLLNFDKNEAKIIILNNIWDSTCYSLCYFKNNFNEDLLDFIIVPDFKLKQSIKNYDSTNSIIDLMEINNENIISFVTYNNKFIGVLSCTNRVRSGYVFNENKNKFVYINNHDTCYWRFNFISICQDMPGYFLAYQFVIENNINNYFTICKPHFWEIWYFDNDKLMVYSIQDKKSYKEKDYIEGVNIVKKDGKTYYLYEYKE